MASSPNTRFADFLAVKGRNLTRQWGKVADVALSRFGTFTAADVLVELHSEVSRATVFRVLGLMVEANVLRQVQFNGRKVLVIAGSDDWVGS